jgi:hypothetical protein
VIFCVSDMWPYFDIDLFIMSVCDTILKGNQHTIVSIVTILWARQLKTHVSAQDLFSFPEPPLWLWAPPIGCLGLFPWGVKQLCRGGDHSLPSSALVKNEWNFMVWMGTALPVILLVALCLTESVQLFEVPLKSWYVNR